MLTVLVTAWLVSFVVLAALLTTVIAVQGVLGFARRLGGSWTTSRRRVVPSPLAESVPARG